MSHRSLSLSNLEVMWAAANRCLLRASGHRLHKRSTHQVDQEKAQQLGQRYSMTTRTFGCIFEASRARWELALVFSLLNEYHTDLSAERLPRDPTIERSLARNTKASN